MQKLNKLNKFERKNYFGPYDQIVGCFSNTPSEKGNDLKWPRRKDIITDSWFDKFRIKSEFNGMQMILYYIIYSVFYIKILWARQTKFWIFGQYE